VTQYGRLTAIVATTLLLVRNDLPIIRTYSDVSGTILTPDPDSKPRSHHFWKTICQKRCKVQPV